MFLGGQKLRPYIPMAKARGFTGAVDNKTGIKIIGAFKSELDVQNCVENNSKKWVHVDYTTCTLE